MASVRSLVQQRYDARDLRCANRSRYRDLQIAVWAPDAGVHRDAPLIRVGGRWDMTEGRYVGPAQREVVLRLTRAQMEAADSLFLWLARHRDVRELVAQGVTWDDASMQVWLDETPWFRTMLYGGRRGGKTWLACLMMCLYAVMIPGVRVVGVSPTQEDTTELERTMIRTLLAAEWRQWGEAKQELTLINGSVIELKTGNRRHLKIGPVDLAFANEAQELKKVVVDDMQGNTADHAGMTLLACNPPRKAASGKIAPIGRWVQELYREVLAGERTYTRQWFVNPELNDTISQESLRAAAEGMTEQERRREILGDMAVPIGNMALPSWSSANVIERIPVSWRKRDVTREVAERWYGVTGTSRLGALDFDKGAGCSWIGGKFFLPPSSTDVRDAFLVIYAGARLPGQHEDDFGRTLETVSDSYGNPLFTRGDTAFVADASSRWQSTARQFTPEDRPSWVRLAEQGWTLVRPDPQLKRNPRVADRFELAIDVLRPKWQGRARVVMTHDALAVIESSEKLALGDDGKVDRKSVHAHLVDCWTYLAWRRWGAEHLAAQAMEAVQRGLPQTVAIPNRPSPYSGGGRGA